MIFKKKIQGSSMLFAMLISVVIALLIGTFLTLTHTHHLFRLQSNFLKQSIEHSKVGMSRSFKPSNHIVDSAEVIIDAMSTISLTKEFWGSYSKIVSVGKVKNKEFSTVALTGAASTSPQTALVLTNSSPLILMDNSLVQGTTFLSGMGVQASTIKDHTYKRGELVYGRLKTNLRQLPKLEQDWKNYVNNLSQYVPSPETIFIHVQDSASNSFYEPTQVIYESGKVVLDKKLVGNIVIKSNTEIVIQANAVLKDVIVIAPKILVHSSFEGNAHCIATKQIVIDGGARLHYPSSLVVINDDPDPNRHVATGEEPIVLADDAKFAGNIVFLSNVENQIKENTDVLIMEKALVLGSVYSEGNVQCDGIIQGAVYAEGLVANFRSSKRVNHLYTGQIRGADLSNKFCGLPFQMKDKGLVKWLY